MLFITRTSIDSGCEYYFKFTNRYYMVYNRYRISNFHLSPFPHGVALHCYACTILHPRIAPSLTSGSRLLPFTGGHFCSHQSCYRLCLSRSRKPLALSQLLS